MPASDVRQRIQAVEEALKDAGTEQAIRAIIDVLKEVARTLENLEEPTGFSSPQSAAVPTAPEPGGRKVRL